MGGLLDYNARMADDLLLAVETSQRPGSVALVEGQRCWGAREVARAHRHASGLLPVIADLLAEAGRRLADVRVFAYSCGPGSFTGLRVAATVGRMLQSVTGCGVVAVPTLEVIARNALTHAERPTPLAVILDARGGRIFGQVFERRGDALHALAPAGLFEPASWLRELPKPFWALGMGVGPLVERIRAAGGHVLEEGCWSARAEQVAAIGRRLAAEGAFCRPEEIVPHYLRRPECEEVYEQRRAEARRRRGE